MKQELPCPACQANLMEGAYQECYLSLLPTKKPNMFQVESEDFCDQNWPGLFCQKCGESFMESEYDEFYDRLNAYEVESMIGKLIRDEELYQMIEQWNHKCPLCEKDSFDAPFEEFGISKDYLVHFKYNSITNQFEFDQLETLWRGGVPGENPFIVCGCCDEALVNQ